MDNLLRNKRLRKLVSGINKARKRQAKQIDILCNDMVEAHRAFIKKLDTVSFAADFYESLIPAGDITALLNTAGELIRRELADSHVTFFLRQHGSFEMFTIAVPSEEETHHGLETCFTAELVESICEANRICGLDSLCRMGLEANPALLSRLDAATVPLGENGISSGFILIYRPADRKLTACEIVRVAAITPGLTRAIASTTTALK